MNDLLSALGWFALIIWGSNWLADDTANQTSTPLLTSNQLPIFEGSITNPSTGSLLTNSTLPIFGDYGTGNAAPHRGKLPPDDVVNYLKNVIKPRYPSVPVWVYLAICYHERGIKNWRDNHLCGYGSYDGARSGWKASRGWQYQFDNLARIIERDGHTGRFQGDYTGLDCDEYRRFARYSWRTTAWQNHCRCADYAAYFKRNLGL